MLIQEKQFTLLEDSINKGITRRNLVAVRVYRWNVEIRITLLYTKDKKQRGFVGGKRLKKKM
jgi:hypothetical protein